MVGVLELLKHMQDPCMHWAQSLIKLLLWYRLITEVEIESVTVISDAVTLESIP